MTLFMWQQLQHLSIRIPFFPLIRIPDIPIHDYQAGMFCRRFRYFLLPPFFHGNYSGLYDAGDPSDHGTGTVSQSAESSMYGFVLSAVAASWTCVYYDPIGENNERNNCMDS